MNELINQIIPLLITCIVGVLAIVIKGLGDVAAKYFQAKREEVIAQIGQVEYKKRISTALDIWGIVDEHFRLNNLIDHTIQSKSELFNELLLERIPTLEQSDLDYLRQAIAGQINAGKEALKIPEVE
jgi:hypothetical protein